MRQAICLSLCFGLAMFVTVSGCAPAPAGFPKVLPCEISVSLDGVPLGGAVVVLTPVSQGGEWSCSGKTNSSGSANISTMQATYTKSGVAEGEYNVTVTKEFDFVIPESLKLSQSGGPPTPQQIAQMQANEIEIAKLRDAARIVPKIYESSATTPVTIKVAAGTSSHKVEMKKSP